MTLIVVAGQSNALGFGLTAQDLPAHLRLVDERVQIWTGTAFVPMDPGANTGTLGNPGAWGPEVEFAYRWRQDHADETLYIVKSAKGSTGLAADPAQLDWSPATRELFATTESMVSSAESYLGEPLSGVLWMQGEQDATSSMKAENYQSNLLSLFEEVRLEWGAVSTPILFGRISNKADFAFEDLVRTAQDTISESDSNAAAANTDEFGMQIDQIHYSSEGQQALGLALYELFEFSDRGINGSSVADTLNGAGGEDCISGLGGADIIMGMEGADILQGNTGLDSVHGGPGDDVVIGGQDADWLYGGQDQDTLEGAAGNDWLSGDRGNDTLTGGIGADTYFFFAEAGADKIVDFKLTDGDRVQLELGSTYSVAQVGSDSVLTVSGQGELVLAGVQSSSLIGDWIFMA